MIALNKGCIIFSMKKTLAATHMCITKAHIAPFCCIPGGVPSTYLDRLSCSPLKPAKDWLRMMPLGPPGEKDWDPTSMISGSLVGSPIDKGKNRGDVRQVHTETLSLSTFRGMTK